MAGAGEASTLSAAGPAGAGLPSAVAASLVEEGELETLSPVSGSGAVSTGGAPAEV